MIVSWETTARYVLKHATFSLTIPYSHGFRPVVKSIVYSPHSIEIQGTYFKHAHAEICKYNPQIFENNGVTSILHQTLLEKHQLK
jgi:hypothetical protein